MVKDHTFALFNFRKSSLRDLLSYCTLRYYWSTTCMPRHKIGKFALFFTNSVLTWSCQSGQIESASIESIARGLSYSAQLLLCTLLSCPPVSSPAPAIHPKVARGFINTDHYQHLHSHTSNHFNFNFKVSFCKCSFKSTWHNFFLPVTQFYNVKYSI